ncbi:hypothetical protein PHMEG_00040256 [Phytophthora megakarya]|uniref:Uncharacterized protein n=1 Tax=Phytophthora megakarya TaxID=4795 RepID=A0A225UDD7_9STRA|nr:hypothetical protein PHMEG_00040256 [Phytophthora megakarya]
MGLLELHRHTQIVPLRSNMTRWSSTLTMLERYTRIKYATKRVNADYDLTPKPAMYRRIIALFETVCKNLREESLTMTSVRVLFDKMAEMYPVTAAYLSPDANIAHSPVFESAVVNEYMLRNKF